MPRHSSLRVGIIGAGVAGLTLAAALRRSGHVPVVFERDPEPRRSGGALLLWSNAMRPLTALEIGQAVCDAGTALSVLEVRTEGGEVVATLPIADLSRAQGAPSVLVWRAKLMEILFARAGDAVRFGKRFSGFEERGHSVDVAFADGSVERVDLLVGADGIGSDVRSALFGPAEPRSARRTAFVGRSRFLHPLLDRGVAVTFIGRGALFMVIPTDDGSLYFYVTIPSHDRIRDVRALRRRFQGAGEPIDAVLARADPASVVVTEVRDREPSSPWSRGRVVLLGDSAHACAPDLGQGACQAIESAVALAKRLDRPADLRAALDDYEHDRFTKSGIVTAVSRGTLVQSLIEDPHLDALWPGPFGTTFPILAPPLFEWILA